MTRSLTAPQAVVDRLNALVVEAVASAEYRTAVEDTGAGAVSSTPNGLGRLMAETVAQYRDVTRTHNIPPGNIPLD